MRELKGNCVFFFLQAFHKCHIFSLKRRNRTKRNEKEAVAETEIPIKKELYSIVNNIKTTMTKPVSPSSLVSHAPPPPGHHQLEFEENHIQILHGKGAPGPERRSQVLLKTLGNMLWFPTWGPRDSSDPWKLVPLKKLFKVRHLPLFCYPTDKRSSPWNGIRDHPRTAWPLRPRLPWCIRSGRRTTAFRRSLYSRAKEATGQAPSGRRSTDFCHSHSSLSWVGSVLDFEGHRKMFRLLLSSRAFCNVYGQLSKGSDAPFLLISCRGSSGKIPGSF